MNINLAMVTATVTTTTTTRGFHFASLMTLLCLLCGSVAFLDGAVTRKMSSSSLNGCSADDCGTSVNEVQQSQSAIKWQMPLVTLGHKGYYLGIFFKANWFRAYQFCRYHGLHLVSIESQEENARLEDYIKSEGLMSEHFWTSGTDQAEEGNFFWMGTGRPFTFTNWNAGEPNNFKYENNEEEHCLELWNRDGKGLKWNDTPCSFETFFVCESERTD